MALAKSISYKIGLDDKEFYSGLKNANQRIEGFNTNMKKIGRQTADFGKKLSVLSAGVGALGISFIKSASDYEEALSKFDTVFGDQSDEVLDWAEVQSGAVNRATADWVNYLASIQDTLKPIGFAGDAAAQMSKDIILLAEDLASFNNLPTEQVVRDLQSAFVGNTETLRKYGVVAQQAQIEQEALNSGLWDGEGAIDAQTKAAAIMNITLRSTTDAQGDAARTADSFANTLKGLQASAKQLSIDLGQQLLPMATDLVESAQGAVEWFGNLDESTQKTVLSMGGFVVAAGPALVAIGKLTTAVAALSAAGLLGPAGLVVALGAAIVGLKRFSDARKEAEFEENFDGMRTAFLDTVESSEDIVEAIETFSKETGVSTTHLIEIARQEGLITGEMEEQVEQLRLQAALRGRDLETLEETFTKNELIQEMFGKAGFTNYSVITDDAERAKYVFADVREQVVQISDSLDTTIDRVIQVALNSGNITDEFRTALETMQEQADEARAIAAVELERAATTAAYSARVQEAKDDTIVITSEIEKQIELEKQRSGEVVDARKNALDEYEKQLRAIRIETNLGFLDESEGIQRRITAAQSYANALIEIGYTGELVERSWRNADGVMVTAVQAGDQALNQLQSLIPELEAALGSIETDRLNEETRKSRLAFVDEYKQLLSDLNKTEYEQRIADIKRQEQEALSQYEFTEEEKLVLNQYYASLRAAIEEEYRQKELDRISDFESRYEGLVQEQTETKLQSLERQYREELKLAHSTGAEVANVTLYWERLIADERAKIKTDKDEDNKKRLEEERQTAQQRLKIEQDWADKVIALDASRVEMLEIQRDKAIEAAEEVGAETYDIYAYYGELITKAQEEEGDKRIEDMKEDVMDILNIFNQLYSGISDIVSQYYSNEQALLDQQLEAELAADDVRAESRIESLNKQLEALKKELEGELDAEERANKEEEKLELERQIREQEIKDEFAEKERKLKREQAIADKLLAIFSIGLETAKAVTAALPNIPLSIAMGVLGAAQLALVASQPIPKFAEGGVVSGTTQAIVGEAGPEAIIPLRQDVLEQIGQGVADAANGGQGVLGQPIFITLIANGREETIEIVNNGIDNNLIYDLRDRL